MKYIVIELQTNANGSVGNFVWAYDTKNTAEAKYHAVLSAAAVSELPYHACCILDNTGKLIEKECFDHTEGAE